jgi:GDPmannose 4,6-dehydratase
MDLSKYQDTQVLVTGCSGFVGRFLVRRLIDLGATVYGLDRWKAIASDVGKNLPPDQKDMFVPLSGNLNDISSLANAINIATPSYVIHLAAQSYVPESFANPGNTLLTNTMGTYNLLESIRQKDVDASVVFAGSSEEYGLVLYSQQQYEAILKKYGSLFPEPVSLPEVPIRETNPLRPMSPYAVSKVAGDYLMRNYYHTYGVHTVVSRAFNHEGPGRGASFVTALIARQVMELKYGEKKSIVIGNVSAFRDWSHVIDVIDGYLLLALDGKPGQVYNQGSQRTNSVLTFILLALEQAGMKVESLTTLDGSITVNDPIDFKETKHFNVEFQTSTIDRMILSEELDFGIENQGLDISTSTGKVRVDFNPDRFRPSEVPILLSSTEKISGLGFKVTKSLQNVVEDQLDYYLSPERRQLD